MALQLHDNEDLNEASEINVTPFIDVMLVLLIIFMIAAPLATVDIKIDLPAASATPEPRPDKTIYVSIKQNNSLYVDNDEVTKDTLGTKLDELTGNDRNQVIFLRGDKDIHYEKLMDVMGVLRSAGYLKVGLVGLETL